MFSGLSPNPRANAYLPKDTCRAKSLASSRWTTTLDDSEMRNQMDHTPSLLPSKAPSQAFFALAVSSEL